MSDERLKKHLLETEPFSVAALLKFIKKYKAISIKPVIGPGEICIFVKKDQFMILSKSKIVTVVAKKELVEYLFRNELKQRYYIIQPKKLSYHFIKNPFQYYITVHRNTDTNRWTVRTITEKYHAIFGKSLYKLFLRKKIENLSILAAQKLSEAFPNCQTFVIEVMYDLKGHIWIQDAILHYRNSKWRQYHTLAVNHTLTSFLPATNLLTKSTFKQYLSKYQEIIIKPCVGQNGKGVVKISSNNDRSYKIHAGRTLFTKANLEEAYEFIEELFLTRKNYLVQQKLPLATINNCPIDVRVITQKSGSIWIATGMLVKVAGDGYFITNAAQKLLTLSDTFNATNISSIHLKSLEEKLKKICIYATKQLDAAEKNVNLIGFDIGISDESEIWIIEGNYIPDLYMFYRLENKEMYLKILKTKSALN